MAKVDAWFLENEEIMRLNVSSLEDAQMIYRVDLPQLRKEWEEVANVP